MDDDQQFCLRWNNHQSTLVAVFDTLLENGTLVDCTLAAEGKFLNAHKVVLSACSPYFEALLSRHYDKHPILILKDVKFQELKAMMDYMYRGEVNISQDQLAALLKAAESLQIKGLSDNKKDEPNRKPAATAPPPKSPQPQSALPKVQGLTIEQRSRDDREGSMSPGPRKKKRMRRKSEEMDNHNDHASNSSDAHSLPATNIPTTAQLPASVKLNSSEIAAPEQIETKQEILSRHAKEENVSTGQSQHQQHQVPIIKEKIETHTELMLEPKSEYVDEMNEDSIEDLTLDDDDLSNMEQMDDGAGPSHGGEGSSQQGFGQWHMGNQSQDEVFLAAQEAVGAHRDSQGKSPPEEIPYSANSIIPFLARAIEAFNKNTLEANRLEARETPNRSPDVAPSVFSNALFPDAFRAQSKIPFLFDDCVRNEEVQQQDELPAEEEPTYSQSERAYPYPLLSDAQTSVNAHCAAPQAAESPPPPPDISSLKTPQVPAEATLFTRRTPQKEVCAPPPPTISPIEPPPSAELKRCAKCAFQTPSFKKYKVHMKYVHGEALDDRAKSPKAAEKGLFSRRAEEQPEEAAKTSGTPKELFSRRDQQLFSRRQTLKPVFKRRSYLGACSPQAVADGHAAEGSETKMAAEARDEESEKLAEAFRESEKFKESRAGSRRNRRSLDELLDDDWF
ncbi:longitudinals lacking protein, isoforms H/M/V-like isoform X1 [Cylas formicarius]|uniref:longitudinals lacking protein, isoforms H/M/V-like isoform X1 n=1 Tax=Cylas formicarius TaxID=197179 RepID=UPI002958599B|nr:longitudinals lacking protein, isoforms H/M/V-like isoform X1 [Cylas formicarius]